MTDVTELNNPPPAVARNTDPATSFAAAASISPETMRDTYKLIVNILGDHGPQADFEIEGWMPAGKQSSSGIRTRRKEMEKAGYVQYVGYTKRNPRQLSVRVWCLSDKGQKLYTELTGLPAVKGGNEDAFSTPESL